MVFVNEFDLIYYIGADCQYDETMKAAYISDYDTLDPEVHLSATLPIDNAI